MCRRMGLLSDRPRWPCNLGPRFGEAVMPSHRGHWGSALASSNWGSRTLIEMIETCEAGQPWSWAYSHKCRV